MYASTHRAKLQTQIPVLVHEPRRRAMNSAEPADLCSTPVPLNSTPRGFSTKTAAPPPVVKPVPFEAPKTLFEKMIQDQAKRNRTAPTVTETPDQTSSSRRGSEDAMSSISQQFAAAAAAEKHGAVRYAAHIPVRSGEATSGRMSSGSVDSQQSAGGNLDAAAKNIDHVIDQARHRHHQHRNKFKEAIDYLDQIFEDLKKESDPDDKNNNDENNKPVAQQPFVAVKKKPTSSSGAPSGRPSAATAVPSSSSATSDSAKKPAAVRRKSTETNGSSNSSSFVTVKPAGNGKSSVHQAPSPVEVVIPVRKLSQNNNNASAYEPTVAETIVLAKKTDKMDFTRRWLHDDLQSLAYLPPANIAPNASYYQDFDEHSLGSCSAEVAAFNTTKERKTSGKPSRKVSDTSDTMIRPRPFRPQPVYPLVDGHPSAFEPFSAHTLPRVTSQDHIPSEMRRSGSQDPYNTLRSMRSEGAAEIDSSRPSPSAFQQVSPFNRNGSMRSSLRSLPDHSPVRHRIMQPSQQKYDEVKDPVLSIDQLVAELELNTENTLSSADKRRSFPTSFGRPAQQHAAAQPLYVLNDYEKPNRYRAEMRHVPTRGRVQNFATQEPAPKVAVSKAPLYSQPIRNPQPPQAQRSLDEAQSMLNRAVSQFSEQRQPHQHPSVYKQLSQQSFGSVHSNNAFETINQEKINPSRVEAMHNMFERGTAPTSWKMHQKEQAEERNQVVGFVSNRFS
uniref:Uncharacterized protein n=1 Tax=Caenorhabditis japonica TaxID=281687 RepID=A0A8R1HND9_CAEJA